MNETNKTTKFQGFHNGDDLTLEIADLNGKNKELWSKLKEKRYRASDLGLNRRVLSHWRSSGLMDIHDDNPEQTRLSFAGLFWLQITNELRRFGISLEKISTIKKQLFTGVDKPLIEVYMFFALTREEVDVFLLVDPEGRAILGTSNEIDIAERFGLIEENYIKINFNIIRNKVTNKKRDIIQQSPMTGLLSDNEISILDLIRDGEYKEITLKFNDGVITHISKKSLEEYPNPINEVRKMIASKDNFIEMRLVKRDGKIVIMENAVTNSM